MQINAGMALKIVLKAKPIATENTQITLQSF